jgi:glutaminyl-peptide cyclotransferase
LNQMRNGSIFLLTAVCIAGGGVLGTSGCARRAPVPAAVAAFNGERAYADLDRQVKLGYRLPGSVSHWQTREYLVETLGRYADSVEVSTFYATAEDTSLSLWNIIAHFKGPSDETLLLGAHWDTRFWADEDPDPENRERPVPGANDGASGVAVLLELARVMAENRPPRNVDLVLFDAEDQGGIANLPWCMGSRFYALSHKGKKPDRAIVVDMIGDRDLEIYIENNSKKYAYGLVQQVWKAAEDLKVSQFIPKTRHTMYDDHIPLIEAGIPAIVIIDFDYPYWHTVEDTPDKCSPQSLEAVGKVLAAVIYEPGP